MITYNNAYGPQFDEVEEEVDILSYSPVEAAKNLTYTELIEYTKHHYVISLKDADSYSIERLLEAQDKKIRESEYYFTWDIYDKIQEWAKEQKDNFDCKHPELRAELFPDEPEIKFENDTSNETLDEILSIQSTVPGVTWNISSRNPAERTKPYQEYYHAKKDDLFASDVFGEFIPKNVILDKVLTGCGFTTCCINSKEPQIIAVPTRSIIDNKIYFHSHLIPMHEGIKEQDFVRRVTESINPIIITTFDSVEIISRIFKKNQIDHKRFNLVVDEYDELLSIYNYRYKAVKSILNHYKDFGSFLFVSATMPFDNLVELRNIPVTTIVWHPSREKKVTYKICRIEKDVVKQVLACIINHLESDSNKNFYLFINNVEIIGRILQQLKGILTKGNCNVFCSNNKENRDRIGIDIGITDVIEEYKKINFLTKKFHRGCDIKDENAQAFIVSMSDKVYTKIDIGNERKQIVGRFRNLKHKVIHIVNKNMNGSMYRCLIDYEEEVKNMVVKSREFLLGFKKADKIIQEYIIKAEINYHNKGDSNPERYFCTLNKHTQTFEFDENKKIFELQNYKIMFGYKDVEYTYNELGIDVELLDVDESPEFFIELEKQKSKSNKFEVLYSEYLLMVNKPVLNDTEQERMNYILRKMPIVKDIHELGIPEDKLQKMQWRLHKIKSYTDNEKFKKYGEPALKEIIQSSFELHKRYKRDEIKDILQKIYDKLELVDAESNTSEILRIVDGAEEKKDVKHKITKKATATQIDKYFICKPCFKGTDNLLEFISKK